MSVDYPEALWLLAFLPVIAVAAYFGYLRSRARLQSLVGTYIRDEFFEALVFKRFLSGFAFTLTLAFLVVALSDPHWGERSIEDERRGLEIVYLIDVSNSMRAEDILPNRITRSREVARAGQTRGNHCASHTPLSASLFAPNTSARRFSPHASLSKPR